MGTLNYIEQERPGNYDFRKNCRYVVTANLQNKIGDDLERVLALALNLIAARHPEGADYLQVFEYKTEDGKTIKFWIILDETPESEPNIVTGLLPEDY